MAMLKRIRRQFSGGSLGSLTSSGRRRMPRLGSLSSLPSADDGGGKNCAGNVAPDDGSTGYTHDAAGRRKLDGLIAARRWDRIGELLSTDDGRDYVRSVAVLREDADVPATSAAAGNANNGTTTTTTTTAPKFISIFHHIVLSDPPPDLLSDLVGLVGVSQLLRRDDIRPHYAVGCGTTAGRRRASRRSSNSARITHEGVAWTPLHTAVAFCVRQDESATATASSAHHRLSGMINSNSSNSNKNNNNKKKKKPRVDPATVGVLLRHFPALPSITCGKTSVTPLMIEASKGPRADMRLCKRMVDACPTAILIADGENRTAVEYALGAENLRLYRNLHHLYNDEMQKMNGLESRKRMAHRLMAGGGGWGDAFGSSGVDLYSNGVGGAAAAAAAGGGVGDVRKRREGSLTGLHCRAVRDAAEMVAQEELLLQEDGGGGIEEESIDLGLEGSGLTGDVTRSDKMKRSSSRSSNRSSTSAAA